MGPKHILGTCPPLAKCSSVKLCNCDVWWPGCGAAVVVALTVRSVVGGCRMGLIGVAVGVHSHVTHAQRPFKCMVS